MRSASALAWRNLTGYPLRSVLTALAIVLGVGMVLAAAIVGQAASQSAAGSDRGPGIDLEVFSRDGGPYDWSVLYALLDTPGVERVSPSLRAEAELVLGTVKGGVQPAISPLTLLGVDPEAYQALHDFELAGGAFLDGPDTIVLPVVVAIDHNLYIGDELQVRGQGQDRALTLTVAGRLRAESGMDALAADANTAFVPLAVAQALAGMPGGIDHVDVGLRPGADVDVERVKADLAQVAGPELAVVRAVDGGAMGNVVLMQGSLAVVGLIILFAAGFVILNAFAMSVTGRTREIGALRALGMTRRQVMSGVLVEAGLLALMGTAAGMLVGLGLAWAVMSAMGTLGAADAPLTVPWWGVLISAIVGLAVTLAAALQPAWRASRVSPIAAVRPGRTADVGWYVRPGGGRRVGAVLMCLLLVGLPAFGLLARPDVFVALPVMLVGQAALLGATVLLLPALVDPVAAFCRPMLVRWLGTEGRLAADNLGRNKLRTVLTTGALTAGLAIIVATSGFMTAGLKGAVSRVLSMGHEDGFVTIDLAQAVASGEMSFQNFFQFIQQQDQGFDLDPVADALAPLVASGTIEVIRYRFQTIPPEVSPLPGAPGLFVEPETWLRIGNFDFFEGDPERALEWMQRGRAVLLTPIVAERLGVGVGDTLPLRTPHGEVDFTVAGIGGGALLMTAFSYADGETYFGVTAPSFLGIVVPDRSDARIQAALAQVEKAIEPFPNLVLHDYRSSLDPLLDVVDRLQLLLDGLLLLGVVVAGLGVVNTMVINVAERQREIGLLRAVGATQRQVRRAIVAEAATLGLLAALIASALGVLMLLTWGVLILPNGTSSLGVRPDWETIRLTIGDGLRDAGIASLVVLILGPLVAALAAYYPARRAARLDVVEATRSERVSLERTEARRPESRQPRGLTRSLTWAMAWRNLDQHRTRTALSAIAVALGVAMIVSPGIVSSGVSNAWAEGESVMAWVTDMIGIVFGSIGVVLLAAAGFLIFNAFAMAVTQQRRQIGALRSLGMTRRQVMRQVLIEALIVGGMGTTVGLVVGPILGQGILAVMRQMGVEVGESDMSIGGILLAVAMGLVVTLLSALLPARRAARVAPLTALREGSTLGIEAVRASPWPWIGLAILVALTTYLVFAPPGEWSGVHPPWDLLIAMLLWGVWLAGLGCLAHTLVNGLVRALRAPLRRFGGTIGRLMSDNLARAPRRVTLTVLTFAVGLALVVGVGGLLAFTNGVLVARRAAKALEQIGWYIYPFDRTSGIAQLSDFDAESLALDPAVIEDVRRVVAGRAHVGESYMVLVPEIGSPMPGFPSFLGDVQELARPGGFDFVEGDWDTALPLLEREGHCGLLISPGIAGQHGVGAGDALTVQGMDGPVDCIVAGVGTGGLVPMARIGPGARDAFVEAGRTSDVLTVIPEPGADLDVLGADLYALADRHGDNAWISRPEDEVAAVLDTSDQLQGMFNGLLLLAAIAAALGTINTMMMNVVERRHELGLLRAVGATRRQVAVAVTGEAALMGLVGSLLGTLAGVGMGVIFSLAYGGISFGFMDLALWPAAGETVLPALRSGALSFVISPLLAAAAAYPALRGVLRGSIVETLSPERRQTTRPQKGGSLGRVAHVRARFMLGTGLLLVIVLAGLVRVVVSHERDYLQDGARDALAMMVRGQASLVELSLPDDAQRLSLTDLATDQFDADALLRFESLLDDVDGYGLESFAVADAHNVALLSLDPREMGTVLPGIAAPREVEVTSERSGGEWRLYAAAPILNEAGAALGSVRLTLNMAEAQGFLRKTRNTLWSLGGTVIAVGLALGWALATPVARTVQPLVKAKDRPLVEAKDTRLAKAEGRPFARLLSVLSLRARLTVGMILIVVLLVGVLELAVLPFERDHVEETLKEGIAAAVEWLGQTISEGLASAESSLRDERTAPSRVLSLDRMLDAAGTVDWAELQALGEQTRVEALAYVALIDEEGTIAFSDQLALIGETVGLSGETEVRDDRWRDAEIWIISTPLRWGRDGEQVGALQMGLRRDEVEAFLDESRTLFRLAGVIALLVGVLLAQVLGSAVAAPAPELPVQAGQRTQGDAGVRFDVRTRDELTLLAAAFDQMVDGLREREWLRDMFGRFVSHDVAEAIRSGQVRLGGENRVVSVLFCDIRGFTARSERHTPEEIVALLNEYLPVVVDAAQQHEGTVSKFGGDSALVVYGAPRRQQESAYRAVLTALELRANLARLNERLAERGQAPIRIGVGINTGMALAGAVGPEARQEYAVIGETVNLASRIEALNKRYPDHDVLISGWTYEALGRRRAEFAFTDLGEVQVADETAPLRVWAVAGLRRKM